MNSIEPHPNFRWQRGLFRFVVICGILFALWVAGWFALKGEIGHRLATFAAHETGLGRHWHCQTDAQLGFPFAFEQSCNGLALAADQGFAVDLAKGRAVWSVLAPNKVSFNLQPAVNARLATGQTLKADWNSSSGDISGIISQSLGGQIIFSEPKILLDQTAGPETAEATKVQAEFGVRALSPDTTPPAADALPVHLFLGGAKNAMLADALATDAPVDLDISAVLEQAAALQGDTPAEGLENWRQTGGRIDVSAFTLKAGDLNVAASGALGLDSAHRLQGELRAKISGGDGLLAKYGYAPKASVVGGLLGGLLHAKDAKGQAQGLILPLRFDNGRIYLGPIRLPAVLLPLY